MMTSSDHTGCRNNAPSVPPRRRPAKESVHTEEKTNSAGTYFLLMLLAFVFLSGFTIGCVIGHAPIKDVPEKSPQQPAETQQRSTTSPTPQAETALTAGTSDEPDYHRDDITSDGRLLSYEYQDIMRDCCERCNVPYALALAIAEVESRFDPDAESSTSDYGLMQINEINFDCLREMGIDLLTPKGNIAAGVYIIGKHLEAFGDAELAVMAYNNGPSGAKKLWDAGVFHTEYSQKVMSAYEYWTSLLSK